jgi:hypothetical protein
MEFLVLTYLSSNLSDAGSEIVKYKGTYLCEVPSSPKQFTRPRAQSLKKKIDFLEVQLLQCGDLFHLKSRPKLKT